MPTRTRAVWGCVAAVAVAVILMAEMAALAEIAEMRGAITVSPGATDAVAEAVIRHIDVIDVRRGVVLPARDVVIRGTVIAAMAPSGGALPPAKTVIEGRGKFAVPGLIDAHVVLSGLSRASAATLLADGITALRAIGANATAVAEWRRALAFGKIYSPRIARACDVLGTAGAPVGLRGRRASEPGCTALDRADVSPLAALLRLRALSAGGTTPGPRLHGALDQLGRGGMLTTAAVLRAATLDSATLLALDDLGEIAPGKAADIVVTTANPLEDLRHLRAIDAVVFRGEPLTLAHLNLLRAGRLPSGATAAP